MCVCVCGVYLKILIDIFMFLDKYLGVQVLLFMLFLKKLPNFQGRCIILNTHQLWMTNVVPPHPFQNLALSLNVFQRQKSHIHTVLLRAFKMLFESYDFDSLPATVVNKTQSVHVYYHYYYSPTQHYILPSKQEPKLACDVHFLFQVTKMLFRIFLYTLLCNFLSGQLLSLVSVNVP